ncbi:hypothetical protein [Streptomyces brevispora]|uniref:Dehydratase n=1 Tax=Streptomyces brevispora TaxID=887462 RepID=A0A561UVQ6_9ACTN|nr:hypothetical protein [Streptomyces brevispora]TWG03437.1 hypothetical protein FHX80_111863 [Streptomyces brevispora]WSC15527.1 hypothetical protein OIE64_23630 [Streptomyces brevispora]
MSISPSHTSNRKRLPLVLGAACSVGALLALSSPTASAVAPLSATANYDCGSWGSGVAKLTAADSGTSKTIKITSSDIKMPAGTSADPNSITTTLKLTKVSGGVTSQVQFSAKANPGMTGGNPITLGPLKLTSGTLAAGDSTNSVVLATPPSTTNWSLQIVASSPTSATVPCVATGTQSAPFVW